MTTVRTLLLWRSPQAMRHQANLARLERAECLVESLKARGEEACRVIEERRANNHWRETIERIIRGV